MVLKAVVKFCKNVSIGNIFLAKFAGILANIFQHKEIQVYSSVLQQQGGSKKCSWINIFSMRESYSFITTFVWSLLGWAHFRWSSEGTNDITNHNNNPIDSMINTTPYIYAYYYL